MESLCIHVAFLVLARFFVLYLLPLYRVGLFVTNLRPYITGVILCF